MDLVVEGNCYLSSGRLERCCVGIEEGRIAKIAKVLEGDKVHDFGSKLVLPGAIDIHVHFREPGMTHKEDFATGSLAAIHGGVTCAFDMPNTKPPTTSLATIREKKKMASSTSLVDFGLYAGIRPGTDVKNLAREAVGFKLYMGSTTGELLVSDMRLIKKELAEVASSGKILAVHAEDETLRQKDSEGTLEDHLRNRPNECETSAIRKVKEAASGCRVHICHVSARQSLQLISGSAYVTSEVAPHHLLFDSSSRLGTFGKVNPPLRRREDRQALFQALKNGAFDAFASDHAPHAAEEKEEDFEYAPSGMPGVETLAPLVLQLVRDNHVSIDSAVRRLSTRPAELFGLNKGKIEVGRDADLMVVDLMASSTIKADMLHSKCGWTAYEGMHGIFPEAVFLRGELIVERGDRVGERMGRDVLGPL